jgi:O-antigen/teichoic acid export membrane protein
MRRPGHLTARRALGSGLGVLLGFGLWNLGNYAFFLLAGRVLGPEDFGLVAALLAAALVVQTPFMSLAGALARVVGGQGDGGAGVLALALRRAVVATVVAGSLVAVLIVVAGMVDDRVPVGPLLATEATLLPAAIVPLALGQLQGQHDFGRFATGLATFGLPRPFALAILAAFGLGVYAALLGTAITAFIAAAVAIGFTMGPVRETPTDPRSESWRAFSASLIPFTVGIAAISALTNVDVVVAKLALGGDQAGVFAASAIIAKSVLVIPQAIATVALPRVAARQAARQETSSLLAAAAGVGTAASLLIIAGVALLADPIMKVTFGDEFADGSRVLAEFTAASALMGLLIVLLYHQLALGSYTFSWVLAGAAALQVALLAVFNGSSEEIIAVDAVVALLALVGHEVMPGRSGDRLWRGVVAAGRRRGG